MYLDFNLKTIEPAELVDTARTLQAEGYRMVQICANKIPEGYELTYSFDKDLELYNYRVDVYKRQPISSAISETK